MTDAWSSPRAARPVADAPAADGTALAKAWMLALLVRAPLAEADLVPTGELAREAPALCEALLAALRDDAALARLQPDGDLAPLAARTAALAGAPDAPAAAAAVNLLVTVLWSVLRDALPADPAPRLVGDLAERVALLGSVLLAATLTAAPSAAPDPRRPVAAPAADAAPGTTVSPRADAPHLAAPPRADAPPRPPAPLRADPAPRADAPPRAGAASRSAAPPRADSAPPVADAPFLVHDARATERDPWLRPIDFALARHARSGAPFAVLLADLDEVERLVAAEVGEELAMAVHHVERAVRDQLRGEDALVRERIGRYWIVAAGLDADGGRELAQRIADAVGRSTVLNGAPLTVSVGMAVCPHDGDTADLLTARADEGVFAARAAGLHLV